MLGWMRDYLGASRRGRSVPVATPEDLRRFLETRSSHIAQTALYGYIRARSGTRYPELFQNDEFIKSLNIAKWQIWLACLSDLAVYSGGLIRRRANVPAQRVAELIKATVEQALAALGTPPDAGEAFAEGVRRVQARLASTDWTSIADDDAPFRESPAALVEWAPIADELKQFDAEIVKGSVRFRWHEIRRDLRDNLDAEALLRPPE
ncbi:MAG: esterase [Alphaproteobacteria bacterium]|nr:esterase [Alphaproteobacteria bacterium]